MRRPASAPSDPHTETDEREEASEAEQIDDGFPGADELHEPA